MPDPHPFTPIIPAHNSLPAHLAALDLLAARIASLPAKTRWDARIPLNGKGSIPGQVVHTNEVKVDIGGGYWVEMTATEAVEYVNRRKTALLLQHAQLKEAISKPVEAESSSASANGLGHPTSVSFNPLFASPIVGRPTKRSEEAAVTSSVQQTSKAAGVNPSPSTISTPSQPSSKSKSLATTPTSSGSDAEPKTLEEIVEHFLKNQQALEGITEEQAEKLKGQGAEALVTEDGLPIHEIREDMDGNIIGDAPKSSLSADEPLEAPTRDDYWTGDAEKRRKSLWKKVFSGGDTDEDDEDEDGDVSMEQNVTEPTSVETPDDSASTSRTSSPPPRPRRPSSSLGPPPRSILKAPTRKKSVSFDDSVPVPPDSPPSKKTKLGGIDFPMPAGEVQNAEFEPRPVPVIAEPKPAVKSAVGERFAGFSRGFLNKPFAPPPGPSTPPVNDATPPVVKKPSLFAQRKAAHADAEASIEELPEAEAAESSTMPPVVGQAVRGKGDGLPLISELKPMPSMKNAVVERAPEPRASTGPSHYRSPKHDEDEDEDGDGDGDDYDDEDEDDDEDEYDLDDALLAREVALDYHRRQAYNSFGRRSSDDEGEAEEGEGDGNVMMALPSISSNGQIVNPTPDDIRKYIRVGRLENGNLVLAPGEAGFSDEEDGEGDEEKRARVEQVKRQLLGQEPIPPKQEEAAPKPAPAPAVKSIVENPGLPPAVATDIKEKAPQPQPSPSQPAPAPQTPATAVEVPKKVSRFKAARMGL